MHLLAIYAVAGPENSCNSFTDVEIRFRYLSLISIVHWIVDLYFCKWYKLKVAAAIFTEEFGAEREKQTENVHVFYRRLSEGKIATKVILVAKNLCFFYLTRGLVKNI